MNPERIMFVVLMTSALSSAVLAATVLLKYLGEIIIYYEWKYVVVVVVLVTLSALCVAALEELYMRK